MREHKVKYLFLTILVTVLTLHSSACLSIEKNMSQESIQTISASLTDAGYTGLFLSGDRSLSDSIWQNGENRTSLEQIVKSSEYPDLARILASEVLYEKVPDYPLEEWNSTLAYLYSQALALTGVETGGMQITGNQWGFMYHSDEAGVQDYGALGLHLMETGTTAIPHLTKLLDNTDTIFYEGSEEATLGNSLRYRVKDAAAYFIGKIAGIPVQFYDQPADRDAEIERLKQALNNTNNLGE
jgi:hypothetical protein